MRQFTAIQAGAGLKAYGIRIVALLSVVFAVAVQAEVVPTLYQYEALVASQNENERITAAATGLAEMVVRVSGVTNAGDAPAIKSALRTPLHLVESFNYSSTDEKLQVNDINVPAKKLLLQYSAPALDKLLRSAGLPTWSANRPTALLWLVENNAEAGIRMANEVEQPEAIAAVSAAAKRRGLPLTQPLFDLEDQMIVTAESVWQADAALIAQASLRYHTDAIVVGRYSVQPDGGFQADWLLLHKDTQTSFLSQGLDIATTLAAGLDQVASYLGGIYAITPQDDQARTLFMEVQGVKSFADYARVTQYLTSQSLVARVEPVAVSAGRLRLQLLVRGGVSRLHDVMMLDKRLVTPLDAVISDPSVTADTTAVNTAVSNTGVIDTSATSINEPAIGAPPINAVVSSAVGVVGTGSELDPLRYQWVK